MPSTLELREVRLFLTLAEELHFGRTAERLGLTPSRVSQTLRTLEARVGGRLFDRTSRRVRLTPVGDQFLAAIQPAYALMERAFANTREVATGVAGTLRLGMYTPVSGGPHLVEIVRTFGTRHPACRVQYVDTGFTRDQLDWLRHSDVDMLALRMPLSEPDAAIGPTLSREPRVLAVAHDSPLAEQESVSLEELADYTFADILTLPREMVDAFIPPRTASGRHLRRIDVHTTAEAIMRVAVGEIVLPTVRSFLDHYHHPGVSWVPIRDMPPSETALVWLSAGSSNTIRAFARAANDVLRAHERGRPLYR